LITWKKQGAAIVGNLSFVDGQRGNIVLVGPRNNPKGATLVLPAASAGQLQTEPLADGLERLTAEAVIDIVCMQERVFGKSGLESPFGPRESS
jgi:hypothetical protein